MSSKGITKMKTAEEHERARRASKGRRRAAKKGPEVQKFSMADAIKAQRERQRYRNRVAANAAQEEADHRASDAAAAHIREAQVVRLPLNDTRVGGYKVAVLRNRREFRWTQTATEIIFAVVKNAVPSSRG